MKVRAEVHLSIILFAQSVFGILFALRTIEIFRARALLSTPSLTKVGIIFVSTLVWIGFFCAKDLVSGFFLTLATLAALILTLKVCERRKIDALKEEIPIFLDRWILNLRLGGALNSAREAALREHSENFQALLGPVFATQANRARKHLLLRGAVLSELERAIAEPHSALARLEILRTRLRKMSEFRRKSGQAVQQTAIQAGVMVFLVLALAVYTVRSYGWRHSRDLVAASLTLSALGVMTMMGLARKRKWKI